MALQISCSSSYNYESNLCYPLAAALVTDPCLALSHDSKSSLGAIFPAATS